MSTDILITIDDNCTEKLTLKRKILKKNHALLV